jgi:hypothetical protein
MAQGFHRSGIVLAGAWLLAGALFLYSINLSRPNPVGSLIVGGFIVFGAIATYGVGRLIAWIADDSSR